MTYSTDARRVVIRIRNKEQSYTKSELDQLTAQNPDDEKYRCALNLWRMVYGNRGPEQLRLLEVNHE